MSKLLYGFVSTMLTASLVSSATFAADELPERTDDGLVRQDARHLDVLYWRPGASLEPYRRVAILDPYVAFRKNWERDQNEDRRLYRVTAEDMERIRDVLADEFREEFTRELEERGGYEIVDVAADDVLVLRPAIVNLDVAAPDIETPDARRSYTASAGSMTLYMELYDAATNELIGRAIDQREGMDTGGFQVTNSVTNRAEADRILRAWANTLREALDEHWSAG